MKKDVQIIDITPLKTHKVYTEFYWGIGLGITTIDKSIVIILPFFMTLITEEDA